MPETTHDPETVALVARAIWDAGMGYISRVPWPPNGLRRDRAEREAVAVLDELVSLGWRGPLTGAEREAMERAARIAELAFVFAQRVTDDLQCFVEHWGDGSCVETKQPQLDAYNKLVEGLTDFRRSDIATLRTMLEAEEGGNDHA